MKTNTQAKKSVTHRAAAPIKMVSTYGEGTVDRLPSGRYRVRVPDGTGKRVTVGVYDTPEEAERMRSAGLHAREIAGGVQRALGKYGERWLTVTAGQRRNHKTDYSRWMVHIAPTELGQTSIDRVTRATVRDWMRGALVSHGRGPTGEATKKLVSRQTVIHALGLVRRALQEAVEDGHLSENPAVGLKVPAADEDPGWAYLETAQLDRLLALELRPEPRAAIELSAYTGLRQGEVAGLRWEDIDDLAGAAPRLTVRRSWDGAPKTKSSRRSLYLLPGAVDALRAWRPLWDALPAKRKAADLVFPGEDGAVYATGYDWGWAGKLDASRGVCWLGVRDRAGLRGVRWHDLRHTCASHLVMGTWTARPWSLQEVRDYLGHTSVTTTERYAHLSPAKQLEAVARVARLPANTGHNTGHAADRPSLVSTRNHSAGGARFERATSGSGDLRDPLSFPTLTPDRDQCVTGLAKRLLRGAVTTRGVAAEDAADLARAVLDEAPEPVRLALQLAALDADDPARGALGLQLAAAVLAAAPASERGAVVG